MRTRALPHLCSITNSRHRILSPGCHITCLDPHSLLCSTPTPWEHPCRGEGFAEQKPLRDRINPFHPALPAAGTRWRGKAPPPVPAQAVSMYLGAPDHRDPLLPVKFALSRSAMDFRTEHLPVPALLVQHLARPGLSITAGEAAGSAAGCPQRTRSCSPAAAPSRFCYGI